MAADTAAEADAGFERVAEVEADDRARIALGRAGVHRHDRFLVFKNRATGEIRMIPLASIPAREMIIWENDKLRESLLRGLAEHSAGLGEPIDNDWLNADEDERQ
jgi:hypothetical protein